MRKYIYTILLTLNVLGLFSQSGSSFFSFDGDVRIKKALEVRPDEFLLVGKYGFEENVADTGQRFLPFLGVYNFDNKEFTELKYFNDIEFGHIVDVYYEKSNGTIKLLYNFCSPQQDTVDYAILELNGDFDLEQRNYFPADFQKHTNRISPEAFYTKDTIDYIVGSLRKVYENRPGRPFAGSSFYVSQVVDGELVNDLDSINQESFPDDFYVGDVICTDSGFWFTGEESSGYLYAFNFDEQLNLKESKFKPLAENRIFYVNGDTIPQYWLTNLNNIHKLEENFLVGSGRYYRNWYTSLGNEEHIDTSSFAVYFFNNYFDSLKLLSMTDQYKYRFNGPGAIDYNGKDNICVGVTLNNVVGRDNGTDLYFSKPLDEYPSSKENKVMAAMINKEGDILWKRVIDSGNQFQYITDVVSTQDGGCMLAGTYYEEGVSTMHDPLLMYFDSIGSVGIDEKPAEILVAKVFPNPANDKIRVEWNPNRLSKSTITVYNLNGKSVLNQKIALKKNVEVIDINKLSRGSYLIEVKQNNGEKFISRFVVE